MMHGIVTVPVTDLRSGPDMKSERETQFLFGTPLQIRQQGKDWSRVADRDGYAGWCRSAHLMRLPFAKWGKYATKPKHRVKLESVQIKAPGGKLTEPFRLFFGTELIIRTEDGKKYFNLPDVLEAPIAASALQEPIPDKNRHITGDILIRTAKRFIGVPYLWGGTTPSGFDCSGLVKAVCEFYGLKMPRNSIDQREMGFEISKGELKPGDLLFFPGHVAFSCGGLDIIHASASRGLVAIESLDPQSPRYRKDLDRDFAFAKRLHL